MPQPNITIALSKGRIFHEARPLLSAAGVVLAEQDIQGRQLRVQSVCGQYNLLILRATDVPVFVSHGAADIGVVGKDVLMEQQPVDVYEPLDLEIAKCRLMVARAIASSSQLNDGRVQRVATKYVHVAEQYFADKGEQVELIKLYGSMELAPVVGLADAIVDVVDTGRTLVANGLQATELIASISSRLIVNKASMKLKYAELQRILSALEQAVADVRQAGEEGI